MTLEDKIYFERVDELKNTVFELLGERGEIPEEVKQKIEMEGSKTVVKGWVKLAVQVSTICEFTEKMNEVKKKIMIELREQE